MSRIGAFGVVPLPLSRFPACRTRSCCSPFGFVKSAVDPLAATVGDITTHANVCIWDSMQAEQVGVQKSKPEGEQIICAAMFSFEIIRICLYLPQRRSVKIPGRGKAVINLML